MIFAFHITLRCLMLISIEGHSVADFDTQYGEQNLEIDD